MPFVFGRKIGRVYFRSFSFSVFKWGKWLCNIPPLTRIIGLGNGKESLESMFPGCVCPWRRKWQPTPVFLPGKSHGQRSLAGYSPWCCRQNWTWLGTCQQQVVFEHHFNFVMLLYVLSAYSYRTKTLEVYTRCQFTALSKLYMNLWNDFIYGRSPNYLKSMRNYTN